MEKNSHNLNIPENSNNTSHADTTNQPPKQDISDEQILEFEAKIKDTEAKSVELITLKEDLVQLIQEYQQGSQTFVEKIKNTAKDHSHFRRSRGDGNCFFRGCAFAWYERLLENPSYLENAIQIMLDTKELLLKAGFQLLPFEDFHDVALDTLYAIKNGAIEDVDFLLSRFQTDEISNAIVVHFRFMTSAYLQLHKDDYYPFIMDYGSMERFCAQEVESIGRESEEIHIIALTKALRVAVQVVYLDGNPNATVCNHHDFVPDNARDIGQDNPITLLYRPGHYDILYRRS